MRLLSIFILAFLLMAPALAETYTLGSHQVSFNLTTPSVITMNPPSHLADSDSWLYTLNISNQKSYLTTIYILELSFTDPNFNWIKSWPASEAERMKKEGIGGYKYSTMDFQGYPAYEESFPEQEVIGVGAPHIAPECHALAYQIDDRTVAEVLAFGTGAPYREILDTIQVSDAPKKPTKYAPYIGPIAGYAGNGSGAKPGWENQNLLNGRESP